MNVGATGADIDPMGDHAATEEGFTLIELVTALSVLAVAIFGVATVFAASVRTGAATAHRTAGVSLASQADEHLRTVSYDQLGLTAGATSPACDPGREVVVTDPSAVPAADAPVTTGGVAYTVARCVEWTADSSSVSSEAYKQTTVLVSWTDETGPHTVRQESAVYPGGQGGGPTAPSCQGPPTTGPEPTVSRAGPVGATVSWTTPSVSPVPIASWVIRYSTDGFATSQVFATVDAAGPGAANQVVLGGLASDTTYQFEVVSLATGGCGTGPPSPAAELVTGDEGGSGCTVGLVTATPALAGRDAGASTVPAQSISVAVATNGGCGGLVAEYEPTSGSTSTVTLGPAGGNAWQGTLPAAGPAETWDLGPHPISIRRGAATVAVTSVCVVNAGASAC
jgi:prepilin-type N-terminal cleavage/methylation domain-containing protein